MPSSNTASCLTEARLQVEPGLAVKFCVTAVRVGAGKGLLLEAALSLRHQDSNLYFPSGGLSSDMSCSKRSEISLLALLKACL